MSYTGQIARHTLHDSIKSLAGKGNGSPNSALKAKMMSYYGKAKNWPIIAPSGNANYPIVETNVDQLSKGKNLSGKTFKGAIAGMPNQMTGPDLIKFWIGKGVVGRVETEIVGMVFYLLSLLVVGLFP